MKILHISTRLILGGSQENTILSCEGQAQRGHDVHLAYGPIYGPEGSLAQRVESFRSDDGRAITSHVVPDMVREIDPAKELRCLKQLEELIGDLKPDIVHTHSSKAGVLGRLAAWKLGGAHAPGNGRIGVVHTVHGPPFHPYESKIKNTIYVLSEKLAAAKCHMIVTVADAMSATYLDKKIGRASQFCTVYSGMETETYLHTDIDRARERASLGFDDSHKVIGTVARLAEHKGHDDLLDALGDTLNERRDWRLLWVGDGWWRDRLLARVAEMGLSDRVVTTGLLDPSRIPAMMRTMDVLVHPSYREGLPRTVPQALLSATPVVAHDVDGTREACIEGETGRLVRVGDLDGLRSAITHTLDDADGARVMAQRGRELCARRFDHHAMVAALEHVYEECAHAERPTAEGARERMRDDELALAAMGSVGRPPAAGV